jgi:hypothetical protein
MTSNPSGPSMINSPLLLNNQNNYFGTANVATVGLTPGINYQLTFTGQDGVNEPQTCLSNLMVTAQLFPPVTNIQFNNDDGPVILAPGVSTGTISWADPLHADMCTASTTSIPSGQNVTPPWTGTVSNTGGSLSVSGIQPNVAYTFRLICTGPGGTSADSVQVSTTPVPVTVDLKCQGPGDFTPQDHCTIVEGDSVVLTWDSDFAESCSIDHGIGNVPLDKTDPGINTGNLYADITYTITCINGWSSDNDPSNITVTLLPNPPLPPASVSVLDGSCNNITVTWTHSGTPAATNFRVDHQIAASPTQIDPSAWQNLTPGLLSGTARSFLHNNPPAHDNYYRVIAYNGSVQSAPSNIAGPAGLTICEGEIDSSDKDLIKVGNVNRPAKKDCSIDSEYLPPPNGAFLAGETATFKINVCNTGNDEITNVSVFDYRLENLSNPRNFVYDPGTCEPLVNPVVINGNTFTATLNNVPGRSVCSVTFDATITAPGGPASSLYRFYNNAEIRYNNGLTFPLYSAHHPFRVGSGTPNRDETAP